jgi:hypothetical protein
MAMTPAKPPASSPQSARRIVSLVKDPAYWQALGQFIEAFAHAEILLFNYIVGMSRMTHDMARLMIGGDPVDRLIDCARQAIVVMNIDDDLRVKADIALTQLKEISKIRNYLVHYVSFDTSDKGRIISNITKIRKGKQLIEYRASVSDLADMTADLDGRLSSLLVYCLLGLRWSTRPERDQLTAEMPALNDAWRYKPS